MILMDKIEAIDAINGMIDENGYVVADNFAKQTKKIIYAKEVDLEKHDNELIDKFVNVLLKNNIINEQTIKSVAKEFKFDI